MMTCWPPPRGTWPRDGKTLGEVPSALARQGLARAARASTSERSSVPLLANRRKAPPVTREWVNRLRDEVP